MKSRQTFDNPECYINRELSWLEFNSRVLSEASNDENPLFERLRFLAITSSNLDEFFMVRIAGLKQQMKVGTSIQDNKTRMSSHDQWKAAMQKSRLLMEKQASVWKDELLPSLAQAGVRFVTARDLSKSQQRHVSELFTRLIYPVLTPMAVDASRPFPHFFNRSLNLAVLVESDEPDKEPYRFAFVQVPSVLPRFVELPSQPGEACYILLEEIIRLHLDELFRGKRIISAHVFRITRNADLTLNEDDAEDLLEEIEKELNKRKVGDAVRIEVDKNMHPYLLQVLEEWEEVTTDETIPLHGPIDYTFLFKFTSQSDSASKLRFPDLPPLMPADLRGEQDIFGAIRRKDILLVHPYESFEPVLHFVRQAAVDANVLAIKQTLYRVAGDSPIVAALAQAAENGKQVTVVVELRARFDEEKNIVWAKKLEKAGCHVIYGLVGLKTHAKLSLVVRLEQNEIRRYLHLGTGNYNESTARQYTDFGLFTANEEMAVDVSSIFNLLSGYSSLPELKHLRIAPWGLKNAFLEEIEQVITHKRNGKTGRIIAKMNSLTDKDVIQALYRASSYGVEIDLIVRGICCLRPGLSDVSENIRVHSLVGRFLEHGRAYYFHGGDEEKLFVSSADWMTRNLEWRVEAMFPIHQERLKQRMIDILELQLRDNVKRRVLQKDGTYQKAGEKQTTQVNAQELIYERMVEAIRQSQLTKGVGPATT